MHPLLIALILLPAGIILLYAAYKTAPPVVDDTDEDDILDEAPIEDEDEVQPISDIFDPPPTMVQPVVKIEAPKKAEPKPSKSDAAFKPHLQEAVKKTEVALR